MMKHLLTLVLVAFMTAGVFYACQKSVQPPNDDSLPEYPYAENSMLIYNKLVNFKNEIQSIYKSRTLLTIDSAQWYTEAYYNVTSGYPDSAYNQFDVDSASYSLEIDENGLVSMDDLSILISDIETDLNDRILQYGEEVAHMVVGDVNISLTSRSSDAEVVVTTGIGIGTPNLYTAFPQDEYWYYGMTAGRCDLTPSTPPYADAGDELEWRYNNPNPQYVPIPSCNGSVHIIATNLTDFIFGYDHPLIYSEWKAGELDLPCYNGDYWNVFLNYGNILFFGNEASGGLVPDVNYYFTAVDITTYHEPKQVGNVNGFIYYHGFCTYFSQYECLPYFE